MIKFILLLLFLPLQIIAQPRLVVGIVVDQMRYDYLKKYEKGFGEDGFLKLIDNGYQAHQLTYNYVPTYTGPGHASIYTGTTPSHHGIIANNWYDREAGKKVYCTECEEAVPAGTENSTGKMCPGRMLVTTVTDELKIRYGSKSLVYGVALKDRGSVLPAGHMADGAFWMDKTGDWISSSAYMNELPEWMTSFNRKKSWRNYLQGEWNLLLPREKYVSVVPDDNPFESRMHGEKSSAFPHNLKEILKHDGADLIRYTPFGNSVTTDVALELLRNAPLGKDSVPDFLCVSYSSPDYIGHHWGPQSLEVEDNYYRLDRELARLISELEKAVGKENLLVFLTSDHGVAENPAYMLSENIPAGKYRTDQLEKRLDSALSVLAGNGKWVQNISNNQIYIDPSINSKAEKSQWEDIIMSTLAEEPFVHSVYKGAELMKGCTSPVCEKVSAGYHFQLSGDIIFSEKPGWMNYGATGSTHGSPHTYDSRVPLLFYGYGIKKQDDFQPWEITDIAPTVSQFLGIPWPNGCTGRLIEPLFTK